MHYYSDTDNLYIELRAAHGVETREIAEGLAADIGADGAVVSLDIDGASGRLGLDRLATVALPVARTRAP